MKRAGLLEEEKAEGGTSKKTCIANDGLLCCRRSFGLSRQRRWPPRVALWQQAHGQQVTGRHESARVLREQARGKQERSFGLSFFRVPPISIADGGQKNSTSTNKNKNKQTNISQGATTADMLSALKTLTQVDLVAAINELLAAVRGGKEEGEKGGRDLVFRSLPPPPPTFSSPLGRSHSAPPPLR